MLIVLIDHCHDYDLDDDKETVRIGEIGDQSMIRVILILTKIGIFISTWFQIVPFGLRFSKQFLFLMYDPSFCCLKIFRLQWEFQWENDQNQ